MAWWGWLLVGLGLAALLTGRGWSLAATSACDGCATIRWPARIAALPLRAKVALMWRLFRDRRVPWWTKALLPALALYLAMPFDLIPDFIPVLGYLDDLVVLLLVACAAAARRPPSASSKRTSERWQAATGRAITTGEGRGR